MTIKESDDLINQTKNWINRFIIKLDICPFAKNVLMNDQIGFYVIEESETEECLMDVIAKLHELRKNPEIETTLLIYNQSFSDFDEYLDFVDIANQLIEEQCLANEFQLASFHPEYCFEDQGCFEDQQHSDAANFTNRSPFPMLHLLRQSSIEKGLKFYKNPEQIPIRNIKRTRELGYKTLEKLRLECFDLS